MMLSITSADFVKGCTGADCFPDDGLPEIAFLGRSNVGKSSLINKLLNRKNLVKTGSRPGLTQQINFFIINNSFYCVDLPGYGYAQAPKKVRRAFMPLIQKYLGNRKSLRLVLLLMDIRRDPGDYEMDLIRTVTAQEIPLLLCLTKADKISRNKRPARIREISSRTGLDADTLFISSALDGTGTGELLEIIGEMVHPE